MKSHSRSDVASAVTGPSNFVDGARGERAIRWLWRQPLWWCTEIGGSGLTGNRSPLVFRSRRLMDQRAKTSDRSLPWLIQGGMGIAISHWPLARRVAMSGQLGVVSGTGIETVFVRRLQDHGVDEDLRRALDAFPLQSVVEDVLAKYAKTKRAAGSPYRAVPMSTHRNVESSKTSWPSRRSWK